MKSMIPVAVGFALITLLMVLCYVAFYLQLRYIRRRCATLDRKIDIGYDAIYDAISGDINDLREGQRKVAVRLIAIENACDEKEAADD